MQPKMSKPVAIILIIIVLAAMIGGIYFGYPSAGIAVILLIRFFMPLFLTYEE